MKRLLILSVTAGLIAAGIGGFHEWTIPARAAIQTCSNSYSNDGHPGPWRTTNNGGTLHGNTIHISCPTPSTHWHISYRVQGNNGIWVSLIDDDRSGNGSPPDFSESLSPFACDTQNVYRTHVDNFITGGTINKPSGGGGVHLAC